MSEEAFLRLAAHDGWQLSVIDLEPKTPARGIVVLGHAMMVDRRTVYRADRRTLGQVLVDSGLRVLVADLRGHGQSGPLPSDGGDWGYDDLVRDVGAYVGYARSLAPRLPVFLVGHSLFGHVLLAYLGLYPDAAVKAGVSFGSHMWNRRFASSRRQWWRQRLAFAKLAAMTRWHGYAAVRRAGIGSADEAASYISDVHVWIRGDHWTSRDGIDYHANLARIPCPILQVLSDNDTLYAPPDPAIRFGAALPRREILRVGSHGNLPELVGAPPGHMELVTDPRSAPIWRAIATWIGRHCA